MLTFETVNELTLKVICQGSDILYTKAGAFIAGESGGAKNYRFEKVLLGPGPQGDRREPAPDEGDHEWRQRDLLRQLRSACDRL